MIALSLIVSGAYAQATTPIPALIHRSEGRVEQRIARTSEADGGPTAAQPRGESTRPLADVKFIVGFVARVNGFDVFWQRTNELTTPVRTRLLRTSFSTAGTLQGPSVLIHEGDSSFAPTVGASVNGPIAVWWNPITRMVFSSPIIDNALRYPAGRLIAAYGESANIRCGASRCVAYWHGLNDYFVIGLDSEGNPRGNPLVLPPTWTLHGLMVADDGVFLVRSINGMLRAAFVDLVGNVRFDTLLLTYDPLTLTPPAVAFDHDGTNYVVTWIERTWPATDPTNEVRAVTIASNGIPQPLATIFRIDPPDAFAGPIAFGWNGSQHLLIISYGTLRTGNRMVGVRLDREFRPLDSLIPVATLLPYGVRPSVFAIGESFLVSWNVQRPAVAVVSSSGSTSTPVEIDEGTLRRRAVR